MADWRNPGKLLNGRIKRTHETEAAPFVLILAVTPPTHHQRKVTKQSEWALAK